MNAKDIPFALPEDAPTLEQRLDAAAEELKRFGEITRNTQVQNRTIAKALLKAAFPELFSDPPTAWIAPWEIASPMIEAVQKLRSEGNGDDAWEWSIFRDTWLQRDPLGAPEHFKDSKE